MKLLFALRWEMSFSMHKKLFLYTVLYVLSTGRVVDKHPHFVHSSCSEQSCCQHCWKLLFGLTAGFRNSLQLADFFADLLAQDVALAIAVD